MQLVAFAGLTAVLMATTLAWVFVPAEEVRWTLTPLAFSVVALAFSLLLAFTIARRPDRLLVVIALLLLVVCVLPALSLDLIGVALLPLASVTASAVSLCVAQVIGERRSAARRSIVVLVVAAICLISLVGASLFAALGALMGGRSTFAHVASPQGTWVATGYQLNVLATDEGSTEVVVQRDVAGLFRGQLSAFSAEGLTTPQVSWQDPAHLRVGKRVVVVPAR